MNWVRKRLFGSVAEAANQPPMQRSVNSASVGDATQLRRAMVAATSEAERLQVAEQLGRRLAESLEAPQPQDFPEVSVSAICHVADKTLALSWMLRLEGEVWLGEVAVRAGLSEVRLAAARRVQETATLERIVEGSRNKDKNVYRHCSELLRQRRQSSKKALRAAELGAELKVLLERVPVSLSRLLELEKELRLLGGGDMSPAEEEAFALLEQAHVRLQMESLTQRELNTSLAAAKLLCTECSGESWPEPEQRADWRIRLEALSSLQARLPAWLAQQASTNELAKWANNIASRLDSLASDSESQSVCNEFLAALATRGQSPAKEKDDWQALPKPKHHAARMELESRWQNLLASLPEAVAMTPPPGILKRTNSATVGQLLEQLESKVEQGNLADADAIQRELSAALTGNAPPRTTESRIQRVNAKMNELRGWARWSNQQAHQQLIAKAEELLTRQSKVSDLAQKIPALRAEWKRLDAFGPATKKHWERFDTALTKAYEPVAAQRAEAAQRRDQARTEQEALCTAWEAQFNAFVWEQADYSRVNVQRGEMLRQWRALTLGSRHHHGLRKRFDALIGEIDKRLANVRTAEVERCEQLIVAAQGLQDLPDGARAVTQVKALQERWTKQRSSIRLDRGDEQKLWLRFRAACDEVFAKRDALRARQATQRDEQIQAREMILDALAASMTGTDVRAIKYALSQVLSDAAAAEKSRGNIDPLKQRKNELTQEAQRRIEFLLRNSCRAHHELLAKKAALAQQVEAAAFTTAAAEANIAARQAWEHLPKLQGKAEASLADRYAKAASTTAEKLAAGCEIRDTLLLDLEIALGLPSPETSTEKRRRRQLEKLQKRFGGDVRPAVDAATLVIDWYATAALSDAGLDERIAVVLSKLEDQAAESGR